MNAVVIMLGAALLWSFYPMMVALSEGQIGPALFVLIVHVTCGVSAALFSFIVTKQRRVVWHNLKTLTKSLGFDEWLYLSLIGVVATLFSFCFLVAMESTSKVGAAIIIETWPLLAMFLAPLLITKTWDKIQLDDYIAGAIALVGVGMIVLGDQKNFSKIFTDFYGYSQTDDYHSLIGITAAIIGSLAIASSIVLSTEVSNRISKTVLQEKSFSMNCTFIAEVVRRIVALPATFLLMYAYGEDLFTNVEGAIYAGLTGVLIFNIGNVAISLALLKAKSSNINMLYYLTPIMGVFWLYLIGLGDMTVMILIGGVLVIIANLIIIDKNKRLKKQFSVTKG